MGGRGDVMVGAYRRTLKTGSVTRQEMGGGNPLKHQQPVLLADININYIRMVEIIRRNLPRVIKKKRKRINTTDERIICLNDK